MLVEWNEPYEKLLGKKSVFENFALMTPSVRNNFPMNRKLFLLLISS